MIGMSTKFRLSLALEVPELFEVEALILLLSKAEIKKLKNYLSVSTHKKLYVLVVFEVRKLFIVSILEI